MRRRRQHISVMKLGLGLLLLLAITAVATTSIFVVAKMIGLVNATDGDMQVAKWDVQVAGASEAVNMVAGGAAQSYTVTVTNNSDVSSTYAVKVSNIPAGIKVGLASGSLQEPNDGTVIFTNTGGALGFEASNNSRQHTLVLQADLDDAVATPENGEQIDVDIMFTQEDPRA